MEDASLRVKATVTFTALSDVPDVQPGADLGVLLWSAIERTGQPLRDGDVLCITSKLLSRAEGRRVELDKVCPSTAAHALARTTEKDPRLVELILRESSHVSRARPGVLIVRHRLGFICANAGIDHSNVGLAEDGSSDVVLLLPADPDATARALKAELGRRSGANVAILITDSHSRAFRNGTVGITIGCAGLDPLYNQRGRTDRDGRQLEHTVTATADQIAACADLVAGQANEGRPVIWVRGLHFTGSDEPASVLYRTPEQDFYA